MTGTKTVTGVTARESAATNEKARVGVGADASLLGGPMSISTEAGLERGSDGGVAFDGGSDFVFAFRVEKITVFRMLDAEKTPGKLKDTDMRFDVSELSKEDLESLDFQIEEVELKEFWAHSRAYCVCRQIQRTPVNNRYFRILIALELDTSSTVHKYS